MFTIIYYLTQSLLLIWQFHSQPTHGPGVAAPHPPGIRPRVRARRGQATDPHSIAERVNLIAVFKGTIQC